MGKKRKSRGSTGHNNNRATISDVHQPLHSYNASIIFAILVAVIAALMMIIFPPLQNDINQNNTIEQESDNQQLQEDRCHPKRQDLCSSEQLNRAGEAHQHFIRGKELAANLNQLQDAIEEFNRALRIDNTTGFASDTYQNLALLLKKQGDKASALDALKNAVRLDGESFYAHHSLANALSNTDSAQDWNLAKQHFATALELSTHHESEFPPGQSLQMIVLTNLGSLLQRMAHRLDERNLLLEAKDVLEKAWSLAQNESINSSGCQDAIIFLQNVYRKLEQNEDRDRLLNWAVQEGIWRDVRQTPRAFNHALYDIMPKPVTPWINNLERFPVLQRASSVWRQILEEYNTASQIGLQPVGKRVDMDRELYKMGKIWNEFPIHAEGIEYAPDVAPLTTELFRNASPIGQVSFSVVESGTRIDEHCGPTNEMITCHLGLIIPDVHTEELGISVGGEIRGWKEGEWVCFEDSFEHFVWNNSGESRVVLLVNLKHPYVA